MLLLVLMVSDMRGRRTHMFGILADTCVWLDMAKEPQQQLLLSVIEELINLQEVRIILPRVVVDEFHRNRQRIIDDSRRSLSSVFKRVKEAVDKYGDSASKTQVMEQLNDIDHRLPTLGDAVGNSLDRIEAIFKTAELIETTEAVREGLTNQGSVQRQEKHYWRRNHNRDLRRLRKRPSIYRQSFCVRHAQRQRFQRHARKQQESPS